MTNDASNLSRRSVMFAGLGAAAAVEAGSAQDAAAPLTAGQVIDRIKANVGIPWRAQTVDNIIAGAADTPVKGIAVTMMATLDVVKRAAAAGRNMVITHESTFFSHQDDISQLKNDPTYQFKLDFLKRNEMVVMHFHDHWHGHRPDGIAVGMAKELGWEKNADNDNLRSFKFPGTPLAAFVKDMQSKLKARCIRVVGDPKMPVNNVLTSWGYAGQFPGIPFMARPDVDVFIVGETREWELVEYAQDIRDSGKNKALIILGHIVSEQAGMKYCAEWLKGFVNEVPVDFIPAAEPFWSPDAPVA